MSIPGIEARARVEAEAKLLSRHRQDYRKLAEAKGHVEAVRALVRAHKAEYDDLVRRSLDRALARLSSAA
jgi:hypothetical protein